MCYCQKALTFYQLQQAGQRRTPTGSSADGRRFLNTLRISKLLRISGAHSTLCLPLYGNGGDGGRSGWMSVWDLIGQWHTFYPQSPGKVGRELGDCVCVFRNSLCSTATSKGHIGTERNVAGLYTLISLKSTPHHNILDQYITDDPAARIITFIPSFILL